MSIKNIDIHIYMSTGPRGGSEKLNARIKQAQSNRETRKEQGSTHTQT